MLVRIQKTGFPYNSEALAMSECPHISSITLSAPSYNQTVHREECTQCFDDQDGSEGIDVCLKCFNAGCTRLHAALHADKAGSQHALAVNIKRKRKPIPESKRDSGEPPMKKLAIREEASEAEKYDFETRVRCYACQEGGKLLENSDKIQPIVQAVLASMSSAQQSEVKAWEEEITSCQHVSSLEQVAPFKLEPSGLATCSKCDLKQNLWLCLTCGALGCGRQQFGGIGGNGHALSHSDETGHGVAVKLGTVEPEGTADIYCYTCNDARLDPHLAKHLGNFGIEVSEQTKTEKSMTELQVEQNLKFDFAMTREDGKELEPLFGPGLTGLRNLGNSCYMASVLQSLFALPDFANRYYESADAQSHAFLCTSTDPSTCLECQMIKIGDGLLSGRYSVPRAPETDDAQFSTPAPSEAAETRKDPQLAFQQGIKPIMFKTLIGKNHEEFKTMRQQDADEFLKHLFETLERSVKSAGEDVGVSGFKFGLENRLQCLECKGVRYRTEEQDALSIPVPTKELEKSMDVDGKEGKVEYEAVKIEDCLSILTGEQELEYKCPNCKKDVKAIQSTKFATYPDTLAIHARRFKLVGWVPQKVDVPITIDNETLSLDAFKGEGKLESEIDLPEIKDDPTSPNLPEFNAAAMAQLEGMGFPTIRCQKALLATGNSDAEAAMNWLFGHMEDPGIQHA